VSLDGRSTPGESGAAGTLEEPGPGPDELALQAQQQSRLQAALSRLPPQQRLLLRLRFEQDLTLAEVARLTRQQDPFRANRQIQAALAALADLMEPDEPDRTAKPPIPSV
jgi:DNA-directed RNA polymerase specialized sigma24 family protein